MLKCELDIMEYAVTMEEVEVEDYFEQWGDPDDNPDWDYFDECGYNPYIGGYDFDC